ncbi:LPXTG cell wall anchor domain-containing protein [Promicromonospora kroppenstedtii]|uniref:LPXTG cell wall anchor domain-containing protein n=1 Tax=Promicromonospora kroppenstedtii TaxID=440482 RepID=UPI0004B08DC1|nr:LPXTG cell wall anchor domain-containing protein [Promicromonospora kroppenstedtii]
MRKTTVLGATALLVAGLMVPSAAAFAAPVVVAPVATTGDATCPKDGKVDVQGDHKTLVVTAPDGYLITGYCVKAGSANQGLGPEFVEVDPPATQVTISHSSGKDISHYTLETIKAEPTPEPSVPGEEPGTEPSEPGEEPEPTEPGTEPTEPGVEPVDGGEPVGESPAPGEAEGATPAPAGDAAEELAATGASTVIGFTLIALALVGGGVTLIVLRRKGALGS